MEVSSASPALALAPATRRGESVPAEARPGVAVSRPGMGLALPSRLPFERWLDIGMQLSAASTSAAWCLSDWLAFGERAFAGRYRQAVEATSLDYQTLRNYAWVARRFGMSRRRDTLSFGHHAEVGALAEPEQDFWLRKAEARNWPDRVTDVARLIECAAAINYGDSAPDPPEPPVPSTAELHKWAERRTEPVEGRPQEAS